MHLDPLFDPVLCPFCGSNRTRPESVYGGTISEVLFSCVECGSPFGWMKWEGLRPFDLVDRREATTRREEDGEAS